MHLADGTMPLIQAAGYGAISAGFVAAGVKKYYKNSSGNPDYKIISGVFTAFVFISTVFEIPMPFGSSEHPTGTPLMAIFLGPLITPFLSLMVLLLELFLREGAVTTLGANVFSLGVVGGTVGWLLYNTSRKMGLNIFLAGLIAGMLGDLSVYLATAGQLALGNMEGRSFYYYFLFYLPGQIPLAVVEGIFTGIALNFLKKRRPGTLEKFNIQ
ncbi:MAG: energy-coupling factor ABC transporter permease [Clostridia bacterium]|nr:energy-coupling factor ABC transporter permease [Clostridia bacterium]